MQDVTPLLSNYRECVRHLWNAYYRPLMQEEQDWDLRDEFEDVVSGIFSSLVLRPLGLSGMRMSPEYMAKPEALPGFRVVPGIEHGTPILINRDLPRSGYWDHPVNRVRPGNVELHLVRFFDFDVLGDREYRYLEVLVHASATYPGVVGRVALIEFGHAKVMLE